MRIRQSGFTIIEILIVVTILAILAMIVVPQWTRASSDARQSQLDCDLRTVRAQIAIYQAQHAGRTPDLDQQGKPDTDNFVARLMGKTDSLGKLDKDGALGPYLVVWPTNPYVPGAAAGEVMFGTAPTPPGNSKTGWYFNTTSRLFSPNHARTGKTYETPTDIDAVRVADAMPFPVCGEGHGPTLHPRVGVPSGGEPMPFLEDSEWHGTRFTARRTCAAPRPSALPSSPGRA
jgi:general secretion pathway protein G